MKIELYSAKNSSGTYLIRNLNRCRDDYFCLMEGCAAELYRLLVGTFYTCCDSLSIKKGFCHDVCYQLFCTDFYL